MYIIFCIDLLVTPDWLFVSGVLICVADRLHKSRTAGADEREVVSE